MYMDSQLSNQEAIWRCADCYVCHLLNYSPHSDNHDTTWDRSGIWRTSRVRYSHRNYSSRTRSTKPYCAKAVDLCVTDQNILICGSRSVLHVKLWEQAIMLAHEDHASMTHVARLWMFCVFIVMNRTSFAGIIHLAEWIFHCWWRSVNVALDFITMKLGEVLVIACIQYDGLATSECIPKG